ncbi:MAG: protein-methionine-sulfoxide reductase catalytic subunit MsrP [Planctomycetes bacterium]|nr:protein-methionine-sulfoxide reductase catalytic subunit MsrP [Planctomycetota bacterium]NOG54326.1 protein-methionine-sulfoxide reductase catalytic subunit MsrP [Planctomycetota bacterium]
MPRSIRTRLPKLQATDESIFVNRREFLSRAGFGVAGMACLGSTAAVFGCEPAQDSEQGQQQGKPPASKGSDAFTPPFERPEVFPAKRNVGLSKKLPLTPQYKGSTHNNFYEFLPGKGGPVHKYTDAFEVTPWEIEVTGLCDKPQKFDLDAIFKIEHEERMYHFRCVETWAMNVPWTGFSLSTLLDKVEPKAEAKFVRFVSANKPEQMPGIAQAPWYTWPYYEGLRMDEARHELTMLVTGVYGKPLLKQHGAPIRVIVPWKYGYKSPKSIVKIELVATQPATFWNEANPGEYGFLSNVNPNIPHPRWSQAQEYLLQNPGRRYDTEIFNGYGEFVSALYPDEPTTPMASAPPRGR